MGVLVCEWTPYHQSFGTVCRIWGSIAFMQMLSLTTNPAVHFSENLVFNYTNLKIRGTWSANEAPLPASKEANQYVDSALAKLNKVSDNVANCLVTEG